MKYGLYNNEDGFRNVASSPAVSAVWLNTNWVDTAKKISTNELGEGYIKERFTNPTLPNQDVVFIQGKLKEERPKILGVLKRARYRRVEKAVDAELARRAAGGSVGGVQGEQNQAVTGSSLFGDIFKPTIPSPSPSGQSWMEQLISITSPTTQTSLPNGTTTLPTGATTVGTTTTTEKTNKKRILVYGGIAAGVLVVGTIAYFALRKKK